MPLCRPLAMDGGRCVANYRVNRIARALFCFSGGRLIALHGFIKKTQKTSADDLKLARKRMREFE
jgi:phage-related protein